MCDLRDPGAEEESAFILQQEKPRFGLREVAGILS